MDPPFRFNPEQEQLLTQLEHYVSLPRARDPFILSGSAGTGKTSIITYFILSRWAKGSDTRFIVCTPTNKAKDVIINKYATYTAEIKDPELKVKSMTHIEFKTVSQVLGINYLVTAEGRSEFTKGSLSKIIGKYSGPEYFNTVFIVDEASMIDMNNVQKLNAIPRHLIYLGDRCQLPPVNEEVSTVFRMETPHHHRLTKVERSMGPIVDVSNYLRSHIMANTDPQLIEYLKGQATLELYTKPGPWLKAYGERLTIAMGLTWTNKRCELLNARVRELMWGTPQSPLPYLMKNEKIIIRDAYYSYGSRCYSSMIINLCAEPVARTYKPLSVTEWIQCAGYTLKTTKSEAAKVKRKTLLDYGIGAKQPSAEEGEEHLLTERIVYLATNKCKPEADPEFKREHMAKTRALYGIPLDHVTCPLCEFLAPKLNKHLTNPVVSQFMLLFTNLELGVYECQTQCGLQLPILNKESSKTYVELEKEVHDMFASAATYTVKCTKAEKTKIHCMLEELGAEPIGEVTLSYLLGHYWNHVIRDVFVKWDYGYFITVHKSQGSEYDQVFLDYKDLICNPKPGELLRLIYTGLTRAKSQCHLYY